MESLWRVVMLVTTLLMCWSSMSECSVLSRHRRAAQELYRGHFNPDVGGKVPESYHLRSELNEVDAAGLDDPRAAAKSQQLKNYRLHDKADNRDSSSSQFENAFGAGVANGFFAGDGHSDFFPQADFFSNLNEDDDNDRQQIDAHNGAFRPPLFASSFPSVLSNNDNYRDNNDNYDTYRDNNDDYDTYRDDNDDINDHDARFRVGDTSDFFDVGDFGPTFESDELSRPSSDEYSRPLSEHKSHLFTTDPYETEYTELEVLPISNLDDVVPNYPKEPVLLPQRPYEVTRVREVDVVVESGKTNFDCRQTPYPDRHYADPQTGCKIYHYCHADGKQDTFECPYGTIFNEYLGTCDFSSSVYCHGGQQEQPRRGREHGDHLLGAHYPF